MLDVAGVGVLAVQDVPDPFAVKFPAVHRQHGGLGADLAVAGVAQPLPVGAVRGDAAVHVVVHGPQEGFKEVVQPLGGAFEGGRHRAVAVDHQDLGFVEFPLDGKIPEGVPDEFRLEPPVLAVADEYVLHDLGPARGADVVCAGGGEIQIAVRRQIFREAQDDPAAPGGMGPQADQAADVLSGVVNAAAQGYGVEDLRADIPGTQPGT